MRSAYGPHRDHWGELLLPEPRGHAPRVVVLLHGGNWDAAYGAAQTSGLARDLARRGWAAWNLEFRRVGPTSGGGWPQSGEDVLAGIDHLVALDAGLDLSRVVVIGFSSGAQLALWAAAERGRPTGAGDPEDRPPVPIGAVASLAGVVHLARREEPTVAAFMGATYEQAPERYAEASPAERLPLGVPTLLVHGDRDLMLPVSMSERYAERARAAGDEVTLAVIPGEDHMAAVDPASRCWAATLAWLSER